MKGKTKILIALAALAVLSLAACAGLDAALAAASAPPIYPMGYEPDDNAAILVLDRVKVTKIDGERLSLGSTSPRVMTNILVKPGKVVFDEVYADVLLPLIEEPKLAVMMEPKAIYYWYYGGPQVELEGMKSLYDANDFHLVKLTQAQYEATKAAFEKNR